MSELFQIFIASLDYDFKTNLVKFLAWLWYTICIYLDHENRPNLLVFGFCILFIEPVASFLFKLGYIRVYLY